jgi:hypothetical protein
VSRYKTDPEQEAAIARFLGRLPPAVTVWETDPGLVMVIRERARKQVAAEEREAKRRARITAQRRAHQDQVPAGLYAVDGPIGTMFVSVAYDDGPAPVIAELKGTPVSHVREMNRMLLTRAPAEAVFEAIAADTPVAAGRRFGRELGCCGRCGALLTNELSRSRGYGPDCYRGRTARSSWLTDAPLP